jgi:RimJ/RimL family protein N-acetyltransferase
LLRLETERLILRDFLPEDFEPFFETTQDPEYLKYYSKKEATQVFWKTIFEGFLKDAVDEGRLKYQLAICLKSGELIGTCGVRIEDRENQQASFGCAVARSSWGKGLAFEASRNIIHYGFSSLPIHRIFSMTISDNTRARMLIEQLGMTQEGELRHNRYFRGRWWNTIIYSILKTEWENKI